MSELLADFRSDYDRVSIPTIWVAFAVSVLLHALLIWPWLPDLRLLSFDSPKEKAASGRLQVQLVPRAAPRPTPPSAPPSAPALQAQPPVAGKAAEKAPAKVAPKPPPKPPVLALNRPEPGKSPQPEAPAPPPREAAPAPAGDLSSYIAARRAARGEAAPAPPPEPAPKAEDKKDRFDQVVAANLGLNRTPEFGYNRDTVGGVFQITRMGYDNAEFLFFGWNSDIKRNTEQVIEVRKGGNRSIEIAVVRRMIEIIRQNAPEDFVWISQRLDRQVTLSARARDNAGLEDFLMQEFFGDPRRR
ncbi:MAG: hypothetical protein ACOZDY_01115 [Pseudomonadota bacterium]